MVPPGGDARRQRLVEGDAHRLCFSVDVCLQLRDERLQACIGALEIVAFDLLHGLAGIEQVAAQEGGFVAGREGPGVGVAVPGGGRSGQPQCPGERRGPEKAPDWTPAFAGERSTYERSEERRVGKENVSKLRSRR